MKKRILDTTEMRRLAICYFSGTITAEEERELFRLVKADEQGRRRLDEWRDEWVKTSAGNPESDADWRRLQVRIQQQPPVRLGTGRMRMLGRVAATVALFCVAFFGARLYDRMLLAHAEECYTVTTKFGDRSTINLPDGTQVRLLGRTTLTYPANFNATNRRVELSGAAYFDVSSDEKHRFEVKVGDCSVVVKGTKFNISAYEEESQITTTLLEGAVDFDSPAGETRMQPGEALTYNCLTRVTTLAHVDAAQQLAWIEGHIEYVDVTIVQLCESLSRLYGLEIRLDEQLRSNQTYVAIRLNNQETLDSVLKALDLIVPISVQRQGSTVCLSAKSPLVQP